MADSTCRFVKINIFGVVTLDNRMVNDICARVPRLLCARVPRITFARVPRIIWARVPRICLCIQTVRKKLTFKLQRLYLHYEEFFELRRMFLNYEDLFDSLNLADG